jgi:hypothetical protein
MAQSQLAYDQLLSVGSRMYRLQLVMVAIAGSMCNALLAPASGGEPKGKEIEAIQADVKLLRESVYRPLSKAEVERALKLLHPSMVEEVGGPLKARLNASSEARASAQSLFKIESTEFHDKPTYVAGKENEFVLVPVKMTLLRADGIRDVSEWFYLGGRKKGAKDWVYVDVPRLTTKGASAFFPDFPEGTQFPRTMRKQIRPD